MKLPAEIATLVVIATAKELADRMTPEMESLQLVSMSKAAEMLSVSVPVARRLMRQVIDLGECVTRVRLSTVKQLIEERTIQS